MKCRKARRRMLRKVQRPLFRCQVGMASQVWMCSTGCLKIVRKGTKLRVESMMPALISGLPVDEGSTFSPLWMTNEPRRKVLSRASITRVMRTLCLTTCNLWNGRPRAADDIRTRPTIHWDRARSWSNRVWSSASLTRQLASQRRRSTMSTSPDGARTARSFTMPCLKSLHEHHLNLLTVRPSNSRRMKGIIS